MKLKAKMRSLGQKFGGPEVMKPSTYDRTSFPNLSLNSDQIKEIGKIEGLDEQLIIVLEAKVSSLRKSENYESTKDDCVYAEFKLLKGSIQPKVRNIKTSDAALAAAKEEAQDD